MFVMIESEEALKNVDSIAAVEGVEVIMIGTNDLSIELGIPGQWDNPKFLEAMVTVSETVKRHKKTLAVAGIYDRPDFIEKCIHVFGAGWILLQHDMTMMKGFMESSIKTFDTLNKE